MLQRIRDRISGWIAGVIIALVAGAFMLWGVEYYFEANAMHQNEVAKVNGVVISDQDVTRTFSDLQRQMMLETGGAPLNSAMQQQLKKYALQTVVNQIAMQTVLENEGFRIGLLQAKMMVEQAPEFQSAGKFSQEKLMQTLYLADLTPSQFFRHVQMQWVIHQVLGGVTHSVFVLPDEVNHYYALMFQKRAFDYLIIPTNAFLSKVKVTDADIKNYYDVHKTEYETPAQVSVAYITLSPAQIEKSIMVTSQEAEGYYKTHLSHTHSFESVKDNVIKLLRHQRANKILSDQSSQLSDLTYTNPDSLAIASKTLNLPVQTSPMMTKVGEKTGIFSNPKILETVFSHSVFDAGNNSNIISLPDGMQVVLRIAKKEPSQSIPLKTVQDKIRTKLARKKAQAQAGLLAYQLQQKIAAGADVAVVATQHHLSVRKISLMSADTKSAALTNFLSAAFSIPISKTHPGVLGVEAVSNQGDYAVIVVTAVEDANLTQAKPFIRQQMTAQLSTLWGQLLQHCFGESTVSSAKIKINSKNL